MSPLPAPDPASQQWPNLVWIHATMGDPTGPLISWSLPPTHPAGQKGSSAYTHNKNTCVTMHYKAHTD